jgi:ribose 5-phosphate isomerase A
MTSTTRPDVEPLKRQAGEAAAALVETGMAVGLGTGSTVRYTIAAIGRRLAAGELAGIVGVPTSLATERLARACDIPLVALAERPLLDLTIDGADEVTPELDLIKGLGGALLREKIVAAASRRFVIVVDGDKRVERLGTRAPLPIAVVPLGWETHVEPLRALGSEPLLRRDDTGAPAVTDDGLFVLDCRFPRGIDDPARLEGMLRGRTGVVATGLFLGMAETMFIAQAGGVIRLDRPRTPGAAWTPDVPRTPDALTSVSRSSSTPGAHV